VHTDHCHTTYLLTYLLTYSDSFTIPPCWAPNPNVYFVKGK
jgi:hypothetical protein